MGFFLEDDRCVVDAGSLSRVIEVAEGVTLSLWGIVLANGNASDADNGVHAGDGGCVLASAASIVLMDGVLVTHCDASDGRGGAVFAAGGAVLRAVDTTFAHAQSTFGGAVYLDGDAEARLARADGDRRIDAAYVHIETLCVVANNTASDTGGAILAVGAAYVSIAGCDVTGNLASEGGAFMLDTAAAFVYRSVLANNTATQGAGGAIFTGGDTILQLRKGNSVINNTAETYGGGIFGCGTCAVDVEGTLFESNSAGIAGGGVYAASGCAPSLMDQDGLCDDSTGCTRYECRLSGNEAPAGGGLYVSGSLAHSARIARCTFSHNNATVTDGGAIWIGQGANVSFLDGRIEGNAATGHGGGVFLDGSDSSLLLSPDPDPPRESTLGNSQAELTMHELVDVGLAHQPDESYGAPEVYDASNGGILGPLLRGYSELELATRVYNNSAGGFGGGLRVGGGSLVALSTRFEGNYARSGGGGVHLAADTSDSLPSVAALWGCNFVSNRASLNGGGVHASSDSRLVSIHTNFSANEANVYGGALYSEAAHMYPSVDARFGFVLGNTANSGAGIAVAGGASHIFRVTITGNQADSYGGGVLAMPFASITLNSSTMVHEDAPNSASDSGTSGDGGWAMAGGVIFRFNQSSSPGHGGNIDGVETVRFCGPCAPGQFATGACTATEDAPCGPCAPCVDEDHFISRACGVPTMFDDTLCVPCSAACPAGAVIYAPCRRGSLVLAGQDLECGPQPLRAEGSQADPLPPYGGHAEVLSAANTVRPPDTLDSAAPPTINFIHPRSGPVEGGTLITIDGANFQRRLHIRCRFGSANELDEVRATRVSGQRVVLFTPARDYPTTALVSCSNDGTTWSNPPVSSVQGGGSFTVFTFVHAVPAGIFHLDNTTGPFEGTTVVSISVEPPAYGNKTDWVDPELRQWEWENGTEAQPAPVGIPLARFQPSERLLCMFGDNVVRAKWRTYQKIECTAPAYDRSAQISGTMSSTVDVQVTNNAFHYVKVGEFTYFHGRPTVRNVYTLNDAGSWKARGTFEGNTEMFINGTGFLPSERLTARLVKFVPEGTEYKYMRCSYDSAEQIRCITPPWAPKSIEPMFSGAFDPCFKVGVDVSNNGETMWSLPSEERFLYGDIYVSLSGSDLWGDGTPKLPYRTISRAIMAANSNPRAHWVLRSRSGDTGTLSTGREVRGVGRGGAGRYINRDVIRLTDGMYRNGLGFDGLEQNLMLSPHGKFIDIKPVNPGMAYIDCEDDASDDWTLGELNDDPNAPAGETNGIITLTGVGVVRCRPMNILEHLDSHSRPSWYVEDDDASDYNATSNATSNL